MPDGDNGIYGIWYRNRLLYIGKAKDQPIRVRLQQHWCVSHCHNERLKIWIEAYGSALQFCVLYLEKKDVDVAEDKYIKQYDPELNIRLKGR